MVRTSKQNVKQPNKGTLTITAHPEAGVHARSREGRP